MARMARLVVPHFPHHVTQRGNRRQRTFFSEEDYQAYIELLAGARTQAGHIHLWQERFHSFVMDERYLIATVRYTELNPVRAGLCSQPESWAWSSIHAHLNGKLEQLTGRCVRRGRPGPTVRDK